MTNNQYVTVNNATPTLGNASTSLFSSNLPQSGVTIQELNATIGGSGNLNSSEQLPTIEPTEPLFGEHVREAADTLKRIFR